MPSAIPTRSRLAISSRRVVRIWPATWTGLRGRPFLAKNRPQLEGGIGVSGFQRVWGLEGAPDSIKGAMVAIGNFDGLHRGHQYVLRRLRERAHAAGVPAVMLTFEPHPRDVFARSEERRVGKECRSGWSPCQ